MGVAFDDLPSRWQVAVAAVRVCGVQASATTPRASVGASPGTTDGRASWTSTTSSSSESPPFKLVGKIRFALCDSDVVLDHQRDWHPTKRENNRVCTPWLRTHRSLQ